MQISSTRPSGKTQPTRRSRVEELNDSLETERCKQMTHRHGKREQRSISRHHEIVASRKREEGEGLETVSEVAKQAKRGKGSRWVHIDSEG